MTDHVHFVVQGDFITEISRSLWNDEGQPERALDILRSLDGITYDQCLNILEGRSKLIGDSSSGIDIVEDNAKGKSLKEILKTLKKECDIAIDEREDVIQLLNDDSVIVASPTGRRKVPRRKIQKNGMRGANVLKEGYEFADIDSGEDVQKLRIWQQVDDLDMLDAKRSVVEVYEQEPWPSPPADDRITNDTGWLTPDGKFYTCRYGQHREIADLVGFDINDKHYVRCAWHMEQQWFFCDHANTTPIQRKMIKDFCQEKKIEEPWWMQDA